MIQDEADDEADYPDETIVIRHGEDGTEIVIEDVTLIEFAALVVIALVVLSGFFVAWRRGRDRRRNYRL
jgi:hypothetical protein